ncbi:MAG: TetR/AcrR family transcriptional regulator [Dorea sp.]|nr:TetR/AcrR family transcriptional regulator [Dorea sp.]
MESKSEMTKALLGQKFKELVVAKGFDKITIKMITDAAGVIRPTFYNYFQDKYEVMEWLLEKDVFRSVDELMEMDMYREAIKMMFRKIEMDKAYYAKVFAVKGQNSFEELLFQQIYHVAETLLEYHPLKKEYQKKYISQEIFVTFQTLTLVNGIRYWVSYREKKISADQALEFYDFLMSHSLLELIDAQESKNDTTSV